MVKSLSARAVPVLVSVILALLFLVNQGVCQDSTGVLQKAKKQYDDFLGKAKGIKTVSVMTVDTQGGKMTNTITTYRKGDKSRVETKMEMPEAAGGAMEMGNMETVFIDDGVDMWMVSAFMPKKKLSPQEAVEHETEQSWWNKFPDNAKIVGEEKYGGRDCYVVEINLGKGQKPVKAWLDKDKLIMVGGEGQMGGQWMRWVHSDFREVEGREFPYKTEFFMGDELSMTMVVESIEVANELSDDLFDPAKLAVGNKPNLEQLRKKWAEEQK